MVAPMPRRRDRSLRRQRRRSPARCSCGRRAGSRGRALRFDPEREPMTSQRSIGRWCAAALAMAALVFSAATAFAADEPRFDGVTLRVATYGGPWKDGLTELIGKEMEKLGAKVEFDTG